MKRIIYNISIKKEEMIKKLNKTSKNKIFYDTHENNK